MASVNQPLYDAYPDLTPAQIDAIAAGPDGEGVPLRMLYPMLDQANTQVQSAKASAAQSPAFKAGLANGSIVASPDENGGPPSYVQHNADGSITSYSPTGVVTGTYTPHSNGGFFGDILGGLGNAVNAVTSDPVGLAMLAAMTGGALSNAGLLGGAGATQLTPAAIESAVGTADYGASAAADAALGAGVSGAGATGLMTGATTSPIIPGSVTISDVAAAGAVPEAANTGLLTGAGAAGAAGAASTIPEAVASSVPVNTTTLSGIDAASTATGAAAGASYPGLATGAAIGAAPSLIDTISNGIGNIPNNLLSGGLNVAGSVLNSESAIKAAQAQADAQIRAAQIAADAAKFKPVGVTTGFGSSQFGFDANGNLTSAGYNLTPEMKAQRDALIGSSNGLLGQFTGSQAATAPMATAAQQAMALGNQYLATSPEAQAQKYYQDQMALLEPGRANDLAQLQAQMQAQGRGGFAIGGGVGGQGAANPQLQALYNAQLQQNNQLAANATQGGMDYAKFGTGLVGTGGDLLSSMYGTQTAAFNPYKTALGGAQTVEGLGQNALTLGMDMGKTTTAANTNAGGLLASGMTNTASTMAPANAYSPWGALLSGAGSTLSGYKFDPMTGKAL